MDLVVDLRSDRLPVHFTRTNAVADSDLKTYDLGNLFVFVSGIGSVTVGIIEVEYGIELFTPQLEPKIGGSALASGGFTPTNLVGNFLASSVGVPVTAEGALLRVTKAFEGLITTTATNTTSTAYSQPLALTTDKGDVQRMHVSQSVSGLSPSSWISVFKALLPVGALLTPSLLYAGILPTSIDWDFGTGPFSQLT